MLKIAVGVVVAFVAITAFRVIQAVVADWRKDPRETEIRAALLRRLDELDRVRPRASARQRPGHR